MCFRVLACLCSVRQPAQSHRNEGLAFGFLAQNVAYKHQNKQMTRFTYLLLQSQPTSPIAALIKCGWLQGSTVSFIIWRPGYSCLTRGFRPRRENKTILETRNVTEVIGLKLCSVFSFKCNEISGILSRECRAVEDIMRRDVWGLLWISKRCLSDYKKMSSLLFRNMFRIQMHNHTRTHRKGRRMHSVKTPKCFVTSSKKWEVSCVGMRYIFIFTAWFLAAAKCDCEQCRCSRQIPSWAL